MDECERQRRQVHESADENKDVDKQAELARELRMAGIKSTIAQETVILRRGEIEATTARQEASKARRAFLQEKIALIAKDARFTKSDYQTRLSHLTKGREEQQKHLKDAEKALHQDEIDQQKALARLQQEHAEPAVIEAATQAYQLARRVHCEEIVLLNQRLTELGHMRRFIDWRLELSTGKPSRQELIEWHTEVAAAIEQRSQVLHSRTMRLQDLHVDQSSLFRRVHVDAAEDKPLRPWIESQTRQLQRLVEVYESSLVQLQTGQRGLKRLLEDLQAGAPPESGSQRLADIGKALVQFWNYELASVDDRPITVGKIVGGVLYLLVGVLLARLASRILGRNVLPRFGLNEGACHAAQSIAFYTLCVLFSLLALELVNLPFAAFTFLGGAAAIGIGFGSQNVVNNFISGLILLAEQPLRVGDLVDIDGTRGTVEQIGARSTRVRTIANHEIVLPNSKLLEDKVTNLTLSDNMVRTAIGVSLSPTLPVDEVRRRLLEAAVSHPKVMSDPAPVALFLGFSKSELTFELHFWIRMGGLMECRVAESEVREAICKSLEKTDATTTTVASVTTPIAAPPPAADPRGKAPARTSKPAAEKPAAAKPAVKTAAPPPLRKAG